MRKDYARQPEPRSWSYWIIRCVVRADGNPLSPWITYVRSLPNGRWNRNAWFAKKFYKLSRAVQVAKYLTKRQGVRGQIEWRGGEIEVVKITVERKHSKEWPLNVLDKLARV